MELLKALLVPAAAAENFAAAGSEMKTDEAGRADVFQNFMDTAQSPEKNDAGEKPTARPKPVVEKNLGEKTAAATTSKPTEDTSPEVCLAKTTDQSKPDETIKLTEGEAEKVEPTIQMPMAELPPVISPVLVTLPLPTSFAVSPSAPEKVSTVEPGKVEVVVVGNVSIGNFTSAGGGRMEQSAERPLGSLTMPQPLAEQLLGGPNAVTTTERGQLCPPTSALTQLADKAVRAPAPTAGNFRLQNSSLQSAVAAAVAKLGDGSTASALPTQPQLAGPEAGIPLALMTAAEMNAPVEATTDAAAAAENFKFEIADFKPDAEKAGAPTDNTGLGKFSSATPKNTGTGVATDADVMKKARNENEVAGLDVQVLPPGKTGADHGAVSRPHTAMSLLRTVETVGQDFNPSLTTVGALNPVTTEAAGAVALPSLGDAHLRTVERTAEMMSMHSVRLAKSDAESMSVVIRPGAGTELSLKLRQRDGAVEAHAVLSRGDFQMLNQYWPELQAKLEQRGIKLAPLGGEGDFTSAGNGNFSRQQQQPGREESAQQAAAFAEFTVAMNRGGGATARLATSVGGNEWWA